MSIVEPLSSPDPSCSVLWESLVPPGLLRTLHDHPFLRRSRGGQAGLPLLRSLLIQHAYYTEHFTRYLCALMSRLPQGDDVRALAANLIEETGLDRPSAVTHAALFRQSLAAIGAAPHSAPPLPETRELIEAMYGYCRAHDPLEGLAAMCLGAEAIVPTLYGAILDGLRHAGIDEADLYFFVLHVGEDEAHALVMRGIIDRLLLERPHRLAKVQAVAEDMVRLRMALLDAVLRAAMPNDTALAERHPAIRHPELA